MTRKTLPAADVAKKRKNNGIWIDHAFISESDFDWLSDVESLTLWNVKVPKGFLARLTNLWWLDIRGGTGINLDIAKGCSKLKYLRVNQVRGMQDLQQLTYLTSLQFVALYGLPKLINIPSLKNLTDLQRIELGMLRGLDSLKYVLDAPNLKELVLHKKIKVSTDDVVAMNSHLSLQYFYWNIDSVPRKEWRPVFDQHNLDLATMMFHDEWFDIDR